MMKNFKLLFLLTLPFLVLISCGNGDNIDLSVKESEILNYEEFRSQLLKLDGITTIFKNNINQVYGDKENSFKVYSFPLVNNNNSAEINFYCLLDDKELKPLRIIYTDLVTRDKETFHGQVFQYLDGEGNIGFKVSGDIYKAKPNVKVNVVDKKVSSKKFEPKTTMPVSKPGLYLNPKLNQIHNDFSLSRGEESTINYHILSKVKNPQSFIYMVPK